MIISLPIWFEEEKTYKQTTLLTHKIAMVTDQKADDGNMISKLIFDGGLVAFSCLTKEEVSFVLLNCGECGVKSDAYCQTSVTLH